MRPVALGWETPDRGAAGELGAHASPKASSCSALGDWQGWQSVCSHAQPLDFFF